MSIAGSGLVTSLSNEGCHVVSEDSLPARACLSLHVEFPAPYEPLTVEVAEVRWTNATGFGLVFVHVHDEEQTRLAALYRLAEADAQQLACPGVR